jgi:cell division protein FtsB
MIPDFKKKQKRGLQKNNIILVLILILSIIVFIFLITANIKIYKKKQKLVLHLKSLENQTEEIKNNNAQLNEGIQKVTDNDYIEKIAREQLNLQKNDETTAVFLMPKPQEEKIENQTQSKNWLGKILQNIISIFK